MARHRKNLLSALDNLVIDESKTGKGWQTRKYNTLEEVRESQRKTLLKMRRAAGGLQVTIDLDAAAGASMLYLIKQWGFKSRRETMQVALKFLAQRTREGLERIDV
jgi:hypothetical protein